MEIKQQIIKCAEELFYQYGLKSVTMDDIAKALGVSKRTIYEYYPARDSIVQELFMNYREKTIRCIETYRRASKNAIEEIIMNVHQLKFISNTLNKSLSFEFKKYYPDLWVELDTILMQCISDNLKWGIQQGVYRKDIDIKILSRLRMEEIEQALNPEMFPKAQYDITRIQLVLLDHFIYGIATTKGYQLIEKYKKSNFAAHFTVLNKKLIYRKNSK